MPKGAPAGPRAKRHAAPAEKLASDHRDEACPPTGSAGSQRELSADAVFLLTGYRAGESGTLFQLQMLTDF